MHILITGGAGFIGSNLISHLLQKDPATKITCIDNFDPFYAPEIKRARIEEFSKSPNFQLLELDLAETNANVLAVHLDQPIDIIVHLAAKAGVRPSIENPDAYVRANVLALQHLLDFARLKNITQFVFASSSSVYGVNPDLPWKEDQQLMPISPYAMTKLTGEMMGHVYHKLYGIRFIALRFFTVYGPGQRPDLAIHQFTRKISEGQPINMYGDGSTSRDYTFVDDIVQGIEAAMKYQDSGFEIINLGNNKTIPLKDLIAAIEKTLGKKAIINQQPEQPGDVPHTYADISKAHRLLNYQPTTKIEEGLEKFREWYSRQAAAQS